MNRLHVAVVFSLVVVASGCVSINVNHEIEKDGTSNVEFNVQSESQYARNIVKTGFKETLKTDNAVLSEDDSSFTYRFEDVYFKGRGEQGGEDSPIKDVEMEKDGGIIYTSYTIRINSTGINDSEGELGSSSTFGSESSGLGNSYGDSLTGGLEFNYNVDPFGKITDTNGQRLDEGRVRFDLTEEKNYYVTFRGYSADLFIAKTLGSQPEKPEVETSEWSECSENGTQTREVDIKKGEDSLLFKKPEERSCEYTTELMPSQMVLDDSQTLSWTAVNESSSQNGYARTFAKSEAVFTHRVVKPESGTEDYIDSRVEALEESDYTTSYDTILNADRTEALEKDMNESDFDSDTKEITIFSKHDVVHEFIVKGESSFLGISEMSNKDELAQTALENTR